jgi:acyl-coenzyme A synthetase/AMP-(fatty) acid ligase
VSAIARSIRRLLGPNASGARVALCGDGGIKTFPFVVALLGAGASVALLASADLGRTERALEIWSPDAWTPVDPSADSDQFHHEVGEVAIQLQDRRPAATERFAVPSIVFSTSGSTGDPRLVTCADDRFTAVSMTIADVLDLHTTDRILSASPPHFDYGFNQFVLAASRGACLIHGDFLALGHLIARGHDAPTVLATGPSQLRLITDLPEANVRTSSLRMLTSTGAPFPIEIAAQLRELWPACDIRSMYGMTECKRVSIGTHHEFVANPTSVGHPIPGVSLAIDKETDEILVTTPYLMDFDSSGSATGPRVVLIDGRPTLATGDCGRLTTDGQLEITGRLSQFAKINDVRVSLSEAEQVAMGHAKVREAAATAEDDRLVIWCETTESVDEQKVTCDLREAIARWTGSPALSNTTVAFLPRLPRLPNGKVDRVALRQRPA